MNSPDNNIMENIFANVKSEEEEEPSVTIADLLADDKGEEDPSTSQVVGEAEVEKEDEVESPEGTEPPEVDEPEPEIPFHQHPRFKALIDEKNTAKNRVEGLEKQVSDLTEKFESEPEVPAVNEVAPEWFTNTFGDDPQAWQGFKNLNGGEQVSEEKVTEGVMAKINAQKEEEAQATAEWDGWIDKQLSELKEDGATFKKNELLKVMDEYRPSNPDGTLDFKAGLKMMKAMKPVDEKANTMKKMISNDTASTGEPENKGYKTPEEMRGQSWG